MAKRTVHKPLPSTKTLIHTTVGEYVVALTDYLGYYTNQGIPVEEMEVALAIRGKNTVTQWSLTWPVALEDA